jgi:hypothetical protein
VKIESIKAFVRPYISYATITVILGIAIYLAIKFADADMAKTVVIFVLGSGTATLNFWFGLRQNRQPPETPK